MAVIEFNPLKGLTKKQKEIFKDVYYNDVKYNVIRASRQAGKSVLLSHLAAAFSIYKKSTGAYVTPTNKQASNLFNRMLNKLPAALIKKYSNHNASRYIQFINDSSIVFLSTHNPLSFRSFTFDWLIADEFAYINSQAWNKEILPTLSKKNIRIVIASTPAGYNHFYHYCQRGLDSYNDRYRHYFFSYKDNPYYDMEEVEARRKELPVQIFEQEYLAKFIKGSSAVFGNFSKNQTIDQYLEPNKEDNYFFGIDWSGTGEDKTILSIVNHKGEVVHIEEIQGNKLKGKAKYIYNIVKSYNAVGYSECNGLGLGATEELEEHYNDKVFRFTMTNDNKQTMVKEMLNELNSNILKLPSISLCPQLDNEMATYEVKRSQTGKLVYGHMPGGHDDYIDSLMLANHARLQLYGNNVDIMSYNDVIEDLFDDYELDEIFNDL